MGDSKTAGDDWVGLLVGDLTDAQGVEWIERAPRGAVAGYTAADWAAAIDSHLALVTGTANIVTINLGANDVSSLPVEATWKADMTGIIDALLAKWPSANIYIARPWRQGEDTDCDTLAGWIDDIVATYASGVYVGMDERVWLENGDNGATYTSDGIHYTADAQQVCADAWLAAFNL